MTSEQIISFIEGKEPFDQKALSQIMVLLEKYPYFQSGHMFLLKAMHNSQSENYSNQLKISGSFISDKRKLFQFINSESGIYTISNIEKANNNNSIEVNANTNVISDKKNKAEIGQLKIEKENKTIAIENEIVSNAENIEISLEDTEKSFGIVEPIINENILSKNLNDLTEDEIVQRAIEISKKKHKEIVTDFFQTTIINHTQNKEAEHKEEIKIIKEPVQIDTEIKELTADDIKIEPIVNIDISETQDEINNQRQGKKVASEIIVDKINIEKKEHEKIEIIEIKPEKRNISEEKVDKVESELEKTSDNLTVEIESKIVEEITDKNIQIEEPKNEIKDGLITNKKNETGSTDVMNNIFSKIRQIKKEMNINSVIVPETIDIKTEGEKISSLKIKITEEKKGTGRVIKESFIGYKEEIENVETSENKEEKDEIFNVEKEEIKEIGITAKDLFKLHVKNKEQVSISETNVGSELSDSNRTTPISKVVTSINNEKTISAEIKKENEEIPANEIIKTVSNTIVTDQNTTTSKSSSAADSLLKKIEEKKRRIKEEKEKEEREKLFGVQNYDKKKEEQSLVDEIKELTGISEPVIETADVKETIIENELISNEFPIEENSIKSEVKVNKSIKLIDNFIEKIETFEKIGSKESTLSGDVSISSADEKEEFMTETMADIQIQQKNYLKAIEIYQKLILKFPEKKTYFAIQIKKVESQIK